MEWTSTTSAWVAAFLLPFYMFVLSVLVLKPIRWLVRRFMPEGWMKRILLKKVN